MTIKKDILYTLWVKIGYLLVAVLLFFLGQIPPSLSVIAFPTPKKIKATLIIVVSIVFSLMIALYISKRFKLLFTNKKFFTLDNMKIIIFATFLDKLILPNLFYLLNISMFTKNQEALEETATMVPSLITFLSVVILAPVIEEIIFRGIIIKKIFSNQVLFGILISSVAFSLIHHPTDLDSFIIYFIPGIVLASAYVVTDDLKVPISIHVIYNLIPSLLLFV